jgi:glutathionylspermidine amidase/synthetase
MYPGHPYVLRATHALTDELVAKGFVTKPVVGHGGANVSVYGRGEKLLEATDGPFAERNCVYQELFRLPAAGGCNVQISAFSAAGQFAGAGVRIGRSMISGADSDHVALRVVDDGAILRSS